MKTYIPLEEAQKDLQEILSRLLPGEEIYLTNNGEPFATLRREPPTSNECKPGSAKHLNIRMSDDFDAPLDEMKPYM